MKTRLLLTTVALLSALSFSVVAEQRDHQHGAPKAKHGAKASSQSPATKAYMEAADRMHKPMMEGMEASDPDVAFVRGMIPHHQGAIDMARIVLQYGKDPQIKKWANDVIREQQREIDEMQAWLKKNAR